MKLEVESILESLNKFPERNAFYINGHYFTYANLHQKISDFKYYILPKIKEKPINPFGVMIYDDLESYASFVFLLLSGIGFVPISPLNPTIYNLEILEQAEVKWILSSRKLQSSELGEKSGCMIIITSDIPVRTTNQQFSQLNIGKNAYVVFTSGTTGRPKGASISRTNLNTFLNSVEALGWTINETDRFLQMSSMTFDMSILSLVIPLSVGACIYTIPETEIKYLYGYKLMKEHEITFIALVPSAITLLRPYFDEIFLPSVRISLVCGEAFQVKLADSWQKCVPNSSIINIYGPSEATVFTHYYDYTLDFRHKSYNDIIAIGYIVKNMEALILDEKGKDVETGYKGELCLAGKQLSGGYLKNPEKNKQSFFLKKSMGKEKRFYRTGDIVYKDKENCYFYVGRKDLQVKIQGHRVELIEIEKHAREITNNEMTFAIPQKTMFGSTKVVIVTVKVKVTKEEILNYLKSKIPYYMIPSDIIFLEEIPLNINGKIDRFALSGERYHF